ncbi:MAG: hypothetical protein JXB25_13325 [Deltaproteobacteria bacterium]|nr:hypothetical protein [Deltaproteobacteria bacterium]
MYFLRFKEALEHLKENGGLIRFRNGNGWQEPGWEVAEHVGLGGDEENLIAACAALAAGAMEPEDIVAEINEWRFRLPGWESAEQRARYIRSVLKHLEAQPHLALNGEICRFKNLSRADHGIQRRQQTGF